MRTSSINEEFLNRWTRVQPAVAAYISSLVRDVHVVEDVLQEVAIAAIRAF